MRSYVVVALAAVLGATAGCVEFSYREATAGRVGCPYDEIEIGDKEVKETIIVWAARCRGAVYYCAWWNNDAVCHAAEYADERSSYSAYDPPVQKRSPKAHHSPFKARTSPAPETAVAAPTPAETPAAPSATVPPAPATEPPTSTPVPASEPAAPLP